MQPNHFVHRDPEFWAHCSVDDYYHRSVHRFRIDMFFDQMLRVFPAERVTVVAQERMARSVANVVKLLKGEAPVEDETEMHRGYADKAQLPIEPAVLDALEEKLAGVKAEMGALRMLRHRATRAPIAFLAGGCALVAAAWLACPASARAAVLQAAVPAAASAAARASAALAALVKLTGTAAADLAARSRLLISAA